MVDRTRPCFNARFSMRVTATVINGALAPLNRKLVENDSIRFAENPQGNCWR